MSATKDMESASGSRRNPTKGLGSKSFAKTCSHNFWDGLISVLSMRCLYPNLPEPDSVEESIRKDWESVGEDMWGAINDEIDAELLSQILQQSEGVAIDNIRQAAEQYRLSFEHDSPVDEPSFRAFLDEAERVVRIQYRAYEQKVSKAKKRLPR